MVERRVGSDMSWLSTPCTASMTAWTCSGKRVPVDCRMRMVPVASCRYCLSVVFNSASTAATVALMR